MEIYLGRQTAAQAAKACGDKWSPDTLRIIAQGLPLDLKEDANYAQLSRAASKAVSLPARGEFTPFELRQAILSVERDRKTQLVASAQFGVSERCLRGYLKEVQESHPDYKKGKRAKLEWDAATLEQTVANISKAHVGPATVFTPAECALFVSKHAQLAEFGAGLTLKQQSAAVRENARYMADDLEKENAHPNIVSRLR